MSLPECTVNTNNIQNLPDSPTMTADELKQEFDKSGKDLKDYINEILLPAVQKLVNDEKSNLEKSINSKILADNKKKYHIGRIIMDTSNTNPETYLGFGTWKFWGSGKVPVGVDISDEDFNETEKIGGNKKHTHSQENAGSTTLTIEQIPSHRHITYNRMAPSTPMSGNLTIPVINNAATEGVQSTESTGGGQGHTHTNPDTNESSSLQPYITCYMWKRIA